MKKKEEIVTIKVYEKTRHAIKEISLKMKVTNQEAVEVMAQEKKKKLKIK